MKRFLHYGTFSAVIYLIWVFIAMDFTAPFKDSESRFMFVILAGTSLLIAAIWDDH